MEKFNSKIRLINVSVNSFYSLPQGYNPKENKNFFFILVKQKYNHFFFFGKPKIW